MREMRAIAFVNKLVGKGALRDDEMKSVLIHAIEAEEFMKGLGVGSKLNADWGFLTHLRDIGRACAEEWLAANFDHLGTCSTIDVHSKYL
jgi:NTE family protein